MKLFWMVTFAFVFSACQKDEGRTTNNRANTQEEDFKILASKLDELKVLSESVTCTDSSEWKHTPYGNKACGGPQGYLPYSTSIDTIAFLQKITAYKGLEDSLNQKWGIISDCSFMLPPNAIECIDGKAVLKW